MHDGIDQAQWIAEGIDMERNRIKKMILGVIDNPSIAIDSIPARMAMQVLVAALDPDEE
jgi:hypothetical protein